jgi:hypothetical protein
MNTITDTWRQLVRRRLWPVALLLVAALVAVPLKLAKAPEPAAVAAVPHTSKVQQGLPATFVSEADTSTATERRRVLGAAKDPFEPAPLQTAKKSAKAKATATPTPAAAPSTGSAGGTSGTTTVPPVATPPAPKKTYPLYSIKVRFGKVDGTMKTETLERLKALPSAATPVFVYLGVEDGGKTAVFMLTGAVTAQGDGKCDPSPADCQTLRLTKGETEFLNVTDTGTATDAQYQLDLVTVHTDTTTDVAKATASRAKASAAGTALVRKEALRQPLRYRYDKTTGTLHRLDSKSYKELLSSTKRASL